MRFSKNTYLLSPYRNNISTIFQKNKSDLYIPIRIFTIDVSISKEKLCFELAIVTQDPYGLSFELLILKVMFSLLTLPECFLLYCRDTWTFSVQFGEFSEVWESNFFLCVNLCMPIWQTIIPFLLPAYMFRMELKLLVFAVTQVGSGQTWLFATAGLLSVVMGSSACSWENSVCYRSEFIFKILISFSLWLYILFYPSFSFE